jgi:hypothetical protein
MPGIGVNVREFEVLTKLHQRHCEESEARIEPEVEGRSRAQSGRAFARPLAP